MEEKNTLDAPVVFFKMRDFVTSAVSWGFKFNILLRNYEIMSLQREPFLTAVLNFQKLSIARYQVSFYANDYFESLQKVSSAFKGSFRGNFKVTHSIACNTLDL